MAENNEPPAPESASARLPNSPPRRNVSAERQQPQIPPGELGEHLAGLVDSVMVLANHLGGDPGNPPEPAGDRSSRRVRKFQRSSAVEDRPPTASDPEPPAAKRILPLFGPVALEPASRGTAVFNKNVAWPRQSGLEVPDAALPPKRGRPSKRAVAIVVPVAGLSLLALGIVGGLLLAPLTDQKADSGRTLAISKSPDGGGISHVSEQILQTADDGMHKAHDGNLAGARKTFEGVLDQKAELPGTYYQLARLALQRNDLLDADLCLDRSTDAGEYLAPACYIRARMAGMKGKYEEVVRQFQYAVHSEPFNAHYFFFLAESLRRRGQPKNAINFFGQALDRAHTAGESRLYRLKQGYARIEAGDDGFDAELDALLKQEPVAPETWLLAAARAITRSAYPAAADLLQKAGANLPPAVFALQMKDYLFHAAQDETPLMPFLKHPPIQDSTELNGPFLDPTILPAELADPAIWQSALLANAPASQETTSSTR